VRVFALYGCTMPLKLHFEKWFVFILDIPKKNESRK